MRVLFKLSPPQIETTDALVAIYYYIYIRLLSTMELRYEVVLNRSISSLQLYLFVPAEPKLGAS